MEGSACEVISPSRSVPTRLVFPDSVPERLLPLGSRGHPGPSLGTGRDIGRTTVHRRLKSRMGKTRSQRDEYFSPRKGPVRDSLRSRN